MWMRELCSLPPQTYDAIFCSHNLEHYFQHDAQRVVRGFAHVLKPDGFAHVNVPDIGKLFAQVTEKQLDVDDIVYESAWGPIRVRDVQRRNLFYVCRPGDGELVVVTLWEEGEDAEVPRRFTDALRPDDHSVG